MAHIVIKRSRGRYFLAFSLIPCVAGIVLYLIFYYEGDMLLGVSSYILIPLVILVILLGLSGLTLIIVAIKYIMDGRYDIALSDQGVIDGFMLKRPLHWSEIQSIDIERHTIPTKYGFKTESVIRFTLHNRESILSELSIIGRISMAANEIHGRGDLYIDMNDVRMSPEQLLGILRQYHQRAISNGAVSTPLA